MEYARNKIHRYMMVLASQRITKVGPEMLRALKEEIAERIWDNTPPARLPPRGPVRSGNRQIPLEHPRF